MKPRTFRSAAGTLGVLAALALLAPGAQAQQQHVHPAPDRGAQEVEGHRGMKAGMHGQGMMGRMAGMRGSGMMGGPHGAMLGHVPTAILHQSDALGLSDEQIARVEALRDSVAAIHETAMEAMHESHAGLEEAFTESGIDVAAYRSALRAAADRMVGAHVATAEAARSALQVLDAGQREKFLYALHVMHRMHGGDGTIEGHGMMKGHGTMKGHGMMRGHGQDADCPMGQAECMNGPEDEGGS